MTLRNPTEVLDLVCADPLGSGVPILFVHGFSHLGCVWNPLAREVGTAYRPLLVDLRGHGASPWSARGRYDLPDYAGDLAPLLDRLGVERAHVVGHSLGGNVSTLFAAAHPERVLSLTLVDTGPALDLTGAMHIAEEAGSRPQSFSSPSLYRRGLDLLHPNGDPEILDALVMSGLVKRLDGRFELTLDPGVMGDRTDVVPRGTIEETEDRLWAALASVSCPVLVVRGGRSSVLSEDALDRMLEGLPPGSRGTTLEEAGHAVMIDDGPGLSRTLLAFLDALPRKGASPPHARPGHLRASA